MQGRKAELWDDNAVLAGNKTPFFYLNSNIDRFFSVLATAESDKKTEYSQMLLKYGFLHGHDLGGLQVPELYAFADNICLGTAGLVQIAVQPTFARQAAEVKAPQGVGIASVTGYYATAGVLDEKTAWLPVSGDADGSLASAVFPESAAYTYVTVTDSRGYRITTPMKAL